VTNSRSSVYVCRYVLIGFKRSSVSTIILGQLRHSIWIIFFYVHRVMAPPLIHHVAVFLLAAWITAASYQSIFAGAVLRLVYAEVCLAAGRHYYHTAAVSTVLPACLLANAVNSRDICSRRLGRGSPT